MKYLAGWRGIVYSVTSGCFDLVLSGDALRTADDSTRVWPLFFLFMCSRFQTPAPENATRGKNMIGWKIDFFLTENFMVILDRLCAEPMRRSHDFLSLTLTVVGSTSGSCYFLLQYRCRWVCVLCVLVGVWRVKLMNQYWSKNLARGPLRYAKYPE